MPLLYNNEPLTIAEPAVLALGQLPTDAFARITYLTAYHMRDKDFDPAWDKITASADIVLHEEFAWNSLARVAINQYAANGLRANDPNAPPKGSYSRRRLQSIAGSRVKQEFWDATHLESNENRLPALLDMYHLTYQLAEERAIDGSNGLDAALAAMRRAYSYLYEYDTVRDTIGVRNTLRAIGQVYSEKANRPSLAVFCGASHIGQAAAMSALAPNTDIQIYSRIKEPVTSPVKPYLETLALSTFDDNDVARSWLANLLRTKKAKREAHKPLAAAVNTVENDIRAMSDEDVHKELHSLLRT